MTQMFPPRPGFKTCGHHRYKFIGRNFMNCYLFQCRRLKCGQRLAVQEQHFWKV